jgi:hypothetical protein
MFFKIDPLSINVFEISQKKIRSVYIFRKVDPLRIYVCQKWIRSVYMFTRMRAWLNLRVEHNQNKGDWQSDVSGLSPRPVLIDLSTR